MKNQTIIKKFGIFITIFILMTNSIYTYAVTDNSWGDLGERLAVPLTKSWTINFSGEVTKDKIDGIVIEKGEEFIPITVELVLENSVRVTPVKSYEPSTKYTLKI